jgi:hypothetical protein
MRVNLDKSPGIFIMNCKGQIHVYMRVNLDKSPGIFFWADVISGKIYYSYATELKECGTARNCSSLNDQK